MLTVVSPASGAGVAGAQRRHHLRHGAHVHVHAGAGPAAGLCARGRRDAARGGGHGLAARRAPARAPRAAVAGARGPARRPPRVSHQRNEACRPRNSLGEWPQLAIVPTQLY